MPEPAPDVLAAVAHWRARGAAAADPVRFGVIEALARRAGAQQGEARAVLMQRVERLLEGLAAAQAASLADAAAAEPPVRQGALAGLAALVDRLGRTHAAPREARAAVSAPSRLEAAPPRPLNAVTQFKATWSRLRADQRLRQALAQVPAMAGPLNSSNVVNRALQEMRELSPAYLDAFMAHADTLLWLEQASGGGAVPRPAAAAEGRRTGARPARKG